MNLDWQNLAALAVVLLAAVFLTWKLGRAITSGKPSACTGCKSSGVKDAATKLISLDLPPPTGSESDRKRGLSH
jgi:hypothetical protein